MRAGLVERIDREADAARMGQPAWIKIKVNSMVDEATIDALYRASQAGVPVDMVVRGICALRPGVPGLSENIRVRSILGRFLEHSRIFAFANATPAADATFEGPEVYIGSADLMHRNLDRRVEALVRIADPDQVSELIELMDESTDDGTSSWHLDQDGTWTAAPPRPGRTARGPAGRADLPAAAPAGHRAVSPSPGTGRRRGGRGPRVARPPGPLQVALVHRPRYDDWSWPKGKVDPGETILAAATREVAEETGHDVVLGIPLPGLEYPLSDGRRKRVHYWAAQVAGRPDAAALRARPPVPPASTEGDRPAPLVRRRRPPRSG